MNVAVALSSEYPTVTVLSNAVTVPRIEPGGVADLTAKFAVKFTAGAGYFAPTLLNLKLTYDGWHESLEDIEVLVTPDRVPAPVAYQILDGRAITLPVFRQKGNQGGGGSVVRTLNEGKGNGNGRLEPGEEATIWIRLDQGLDPFDKGNWYRAKVYSDSPWITEPARLEEDKQLEWTSARERTSVIRLAARAPRRGRRYRCYSTTKAGASRTRRMCVTAAPGCTRHFNSTSITCIGSQSSLAGTPVKTGQT